MSPGAGVDFLRLLQPNFTPAALLAELWDQRWLPACFWGEFQVWRELVKA